MVARPSNGLAALATLSARQASRRYRLRSSATPASAAAECGVGLA